MDEKIDIHHHRFVGTFLHLLVDTHVVRLITEMVETSVLDALQDIDLWNFRQSDLLTIVPEIGEAFVDNVFRNDVVPDIGPGNGTESTPVFSIEITEFLTRYDVFSHMIKAANELP